MRVKIDILSRIVWLLCLALVLAGCKEEILSLPEVEGDIRTGDPVMFTTYVPSVAKTRTSEKDAFDGKMAAYKAVEADYKFTVEMYKKGDADADVKIGTGYYLPAKTITTNEEDEIVSESYAEDGTLKIDEDRVGLYWPDNVTQYGFKATAGTENLTGETGDENFRVDIDENTTFYKVNQSTEEKLLENDRLLGYGFEPLWDTDVNRQVDNENDLNYRTAKEWKAANVSLGLNTIENYKKIPLYMQHQRSLITVILKAGAGMTREALNVGENVDADIYSYGGSSGNQIIKPFESHTQLNYGTEESPDNVETLQYTAIVEPHDYFAAGSSSDVITEVRLSGQRYTFYASSDDKYDAAKNADAEAVAHMNNYNLTAGKHLIITATIGLGSRNIVITAYVEDWTELTTASIVDDFGQTGDPIVIKNRNDLFAFLSGPKNKAGNVAIINPSEINLEADANGDPLAWAPQPLNCTLNMAGATFFTTHQVFTDISSSGNLVNGTVSVGDVEGVETAVAATNAGMIEHVTVLPQKKKGGSDVEKSTAKATVAGLVATNTGTILDCTSELRVLGSRGMVGGIAATSKYASGDNPSMPVIDGCTVNARVAGESGTTGGGIVGAAEGRVTNNTFEYGITLNQTGFKNIIHSKVGSSQELRAYGNAWPTKTGNHGEDGVPSTNTNATPDDERFDAVIDCQDELAELIKSSYNLTASKYRISDDFTVSGWTSGHKTDVLNDTGSEGNVFFKLDGNNKTITTDGMLFSNIMNEIYDLTIRLGGNLIATPAADHADAIAPLGYAVVNTTIRNIQVKARVPDTSASYYRVQAANAGGVVVWAYNQAIIENCQSNASVQAWESGKNNDAEIYCGGIVAMAADATIDRCVYHLANGTLFKNKATDHNDPSEEETSPLTPGIFYGGILGATLPKDTHIPSVLITDCTSWFVTSGNTQKGAVVGKSTYSENSTLKNGIADDCQGNWWPTTSNGVGTLLTGSTEEKLIGKRNGVKPSQDLHYDE